MTRTTLNIDTPVLQELKRLQKEEKKPLGQVASELLAEALARRSKRRSPASFNWSTKSMRARVDIGDKEALYAALEAEKR